MVRIKIRRKHNKISDDRKDNHYDSNESSNEQIIKELKEESVSYQKLHYSPSQIEMLNQFHRELDNIRSQILQLKKVKAQLEKAISEKKPITHTQLLQYCNNLSMASKGKLNPKKR